MDLHVQDGLDAGYVQDQIEAVCEGLPESEDISLTVIAVHDPGTCGTVFERSGLTDKDAFERNCEQATTSMSYRADDQDVIILRMDTPFLSEDATAAQGLMAHELMHAIQRESGLEEEIQEAARDAVDRTVATLQEDGFDEQAISRFVSRINGTATFCLKDLYANTQLIESGFAEELHTYYLQALALEEYCPLPDFYGAAADLEEIEDAIAFDLELLPAWLPFAVTDNSQISQIKEAIRDCYEHNIPDVAYYLGTVQGVFSEVYDGRKPMSVFFSAVIDQSFDVMEKKDLL